MKAICITIAYIGLLLFASTPFAQDIPIRIEGQHTTGIPPALHTKISIDLDNEMLETVLAAIANQGGFQLNYNRSRFPVGRKISVHMLNMPALDVLLYVLNETGMELLMTASNQLILARAKETEGTLSGFVVDAESGEALANANMVLKGEDFGASALSNADGYYTLQNVPVDRRLLLVVSYVGHSSYRDSISLTDEKSRQLDISLIADPMGFLLKEMVVTPGHFSVLKRDPVVTQNLSREDVETMPAHFEDTYRAIERLPGVTSSEYSARFSIRGGDHDHVLVTLDGLELSEPFHLKDIASGALSVIDPEVINNVDVLLGGFPAEYGDRQNGVVEIKSKTSDVKQGIQAGIGLTGVGLLYEGKNEAVDWLFSARRGYLDLGLKFIGEENMSPSYYDTFGKLSFGNDRHRFQFNFLWSADTLEDIEERDTFSSSYGNGYAWFAWEATYGARFYMRHLPYVGLSTQMRDGQTFYRRGGTRDIVQDDRQIQLYGTKSDGYFELSPRSAFKFGFDIKRQLADYTYFNRRLTGGLISPEGTPERVDTIQVALKPSDTKVGLYIGNKLHIKEPLVADLGLRYDRHSNTGEAHISPRVGLALSLGEKTVVRAAWGRFYQGQGIEDLDVQDGVTQYRDAELATHYVIGGERQLTSKLHLRVEGYYKTLRNIRDRFEGRDDLNEYLPEVDNARIHLFPDRGSVKGAELYIKRESGSRISFWASYTYSIAKEIHDDFFSHPDLRGKELPQKFDQRHSASVDLTWHLNKRTSISMAWQIRSGWPHTPLEEAENAEGLKYYIARPGNLYVDRYPSFHRLDLKTNHTLIFEGWQMLLSFELINAYNQGNIRSYNYFSNGSTFTRGSKGWLPLVPSFSIKATF